jgi:phosphatidylserine decarboxylase
MSRRRRALRWSVRSSVVVLGLVGLDVAVAAIRALLGGVAVVERGTGRPVREPRPFGEQARIVVVWWTVLGSYGLCRTGWFLRYLQRHSVAYGEKMDAPAAPETIDEFIAGYDIDVSTFDRHPHEFRTLNELFSRPLRRGAREVAEPGDAAVAVSPADCRLMCLAAADATTEVSVKGRPYDVARLLGASGGAGARTVAHDRVRGFYEAARDSGFALAICRLAPGDYHRIHWPVQGTWRREEMLTVPGALHSVARGAAGPGDILGRNRRSVCIVETSTFGDVAVVVVGAVRVGSIEMTAPTGAVTKGAEMGLFRYGGSTVVVVFRHSTIAFDAELVANAARGLETLVTVGSVLGRATRSGDRP